MLPDAPLDALPNVLPEEPVAVAAPDPALVTRSGRVRKLAYGRFKDFQPTSYAGPSTPRILPPAAPPREATPPILASAVPSPRFPPLIEEAELEYLEALPEALDFIAAPDRDLPASEAESQPRDASEVRSTEYRSSTNSFGLYRVFPVRPKRDPEESDRSLESYCDPVAFDMRPSRQANNRVPPGHESNFTEDRHSDLPPPYAPFPNVTTFDMLYWQNSGSNMKSDQQMNALATEVMQADGFEPAHLVQFDAARALRLLDNYVEEDTGSPLSAKDGWLQGKVSVRVPKEGVRYSSEDAAPLFTLEGVWHRSFREVLRSALQQDCMKDWHMIPHHLYVKADPAGKQRASSPTPSCSSQSTASSTSSSSSCSTSSSSSTSSRRSTTLSSSADDEDERAYSEIFNADVALEEDAAMRAQPRQPGDPDDLEYCVTLICLYSDATRLTNFGTSKLWPLYMYIGNQSKYVRGQPTAYAAYHMAYIPSVRCMARTFRAHLMAFILASGPRTRLLHR